MKKNSKSSLATETRSITLDLAALRAVIGGRTKSSDAYFVKVDRETTTQ